MFITIKNNPVFQEDCKKFQEIIDGAKDDQEKTYNQKLYERFLSVANELDNSVEKLSVSMLEYEQHNSIRDQLISIKKQLYERFTEMKRTHV